MAAGLIQKMRFGRENNPHYQKIWCEGKKTGTALRLSLTDSKALLALHFLFVIDTFMDAEHLLGVLISLKALN